MSDWQKWGVVVILILLAGGLRFYGLERESLWLDEAFTLRLAPRSFGEIIEVSRTDVHPPLYYFLLHPLIKAGGGITAARAASALFGILTAIAVFLLTKELFGFNPSLLALLFVVLNPFQIYFSQEARMHIFCTFFTVLALWFFVRYLKLPSWWSLFAYFAASLASLYTFYYGAFAVLSQSVFLLIYFRTHRRSVLKLLGAQALCLILFLPWIPILLGQIKIVISGYWIGKVLGPVSPRIVPEILVRMSSNIPLYLDRVHLGAMTAFLVVCALILFLVFGRKPESIKGSAVLLGLFLLLPVVAGLVLSLKERVILDRYFIVASSALFPMIAAGVFRARPRWAGLVVALLIALLNMAALIGGYNQPRKGPMREMAAFVNAKWSPADAILHLHSHSYFPFLYYLSHDKPQYLLTPPGTPVDQEKVLIPEGGAVANPAPVFTQSPRVWVVASFPYRGALPPPRGMVTVEEADFTYPDSWLSGRVVCFKKKTARESANPVPVGK
ncbi:glycosyltransferase family 39 protein [Acidobacteriota bacterium]